MVLARSANSRLAGLRFMFFVAFIVFCVAYVDRPVSTWVADHLHVYRHQFDDLTHVVDPLLPLSSIGVITGACTAWVGRPLGPRARALLVASVAIAVAILLKEQAKFLFGRLWPETWVDNNPSWIGTKDYGFSPFHGGRGWGSFPSGHMTVITAPMAVFWQVWPAFRIVAALLCFVVAFGLLGADYHFVGDIVAGTGLGAACGLGVLALMAVDVSSSNWTLRSLRPSHAFSPADREHG